MDLSVLHVLNIAVRVAGRLCVGQKSMLSAGRSISAGIKLSNRRTQKQAQVLRKTILIPLEMNLPYKVTLIIEA